MEVDNLYYNTHISSIPKAILREILDNELLDLMMDFGQKINKTDPEFEHIRFRVGKLLVDKYPLWRFGLFDQCIREGKVNKFDKASRITAQRIELWLSSYAKQSNYNLNQTQDTITEYPYPPEYYIEQASRNIPAYNFRVANKPTYDSDKWTLAKIEGLNEFQQWKSSQPKTQTLISKSDENYSTNHN